MTVPGGGGRVAGGRCPSLGTLTDGIGLFVQVPPRIHPTATHHVTNEGVPASLPCVTSGIPAPTITWTKVGRAWSCVGPQRWAQCSLGRVGVWAAPSVACGSALGHQGSDFPGCPLQREQEWDPAHRPADHPGCRGLRLHGHQCSGLLQPGDVAVCQ